MPTECRTDRATSRREAVGWRRGSVVWRARGVMGCTGGVNIGASKLNTVGGLRCFCPHKYDGVMRCRSSRVGCGCFMRSAIVRWERARDRASGGGESGAAD
eukprot:7135255-Pyramimonas_sp.AAC.1